MERYYRFKSVRKNPNYETSATTIPLCSCLIRHNSEKKGVNNSSVTVRYEPKYISTLECNNVDSEGNVTYLRTIETDSFKRANYRKRNALDTFFSYYRPLYKSKEVSLFIFTFTQANQAKKGFSYVLDNVKYRFKSLNSAIRGYVWTSEISDDNHWHYHLCIATDRLSFKNVESLKFDKVWGQRTQIDTVKNTFAKQFYLTKKQPKIDRHKGFGKSKDFK